MSSKGVKEYTLKINGLTQSAKDATTLAEALKYIESGVTSASTATVKITTAAKGAAKGLTEEEKAAKKLADTLAKTSKIQSGANDEQIRAAQALREATREATLRARAENAAEGSIEQMRAKLALLNSKWKQLDRGSEAFQQMSAEILQLNENIKRAEESTGDFRRSVGNYEKATEGLGKLATNIEGVSKTTMGLAQGLMGSTMMLSLFGDQSEEDAKRVQNLQKLIALLSIAEQVNTNVLKEGIVQNKLAAVTDGIRAVQVKAKTAAEAASTKGTVAATIAQKAFNLVASANPYVILALALVGVVSALFVFSSSTEDATDKQKKLNEEQSVFLDGLEQESTRIRDASNERVTQMERQMRTLEAHGSKQKEIRAIEDKIAEERRKNNSYLRGYYAQEIHDLDTNRDKLKKYQQVLQQLNEAKARGENKLHIDVDLDGQVEKVKVEEAIEAVQGSIDNMGRSVKVAVDLNTERAELDAEEQIRAAQRKKQAADTAKEIARVELDAVRAAEDAKTRTIADAEEKARRQMEVGYDRQIEDLKKRLATEADLTSKARGAINATILSLETEKGQALDKLAKDQAQARATAELELARQVEDQRTALTLGEYDRRRAEVNAKYDRQVEDLKKRLETDKTLTAQAQEYITQLIVGAEDARQKELTGIDVSETDKRTSQQLALIDDWVAETEQKIGTLKVRDKDGLQLIDVDATRVNLDATNQMLATYVTRLESYRDELTASHEATLSTLKEGTPEYEEELLRYSEAMQGLTKRIKDAQKQQEDNTKSSAEVQQEYYKELYGKLQGYAEMGLQAIGAVTDTITMALQAQIDDLNAQLDVVNGRYEEAQKRREDSVARVEQLESDLQNATGGTAEALKSQLQEEMANRAEAEREELRLAKEKERREAEIQKKEKQMKRVDMVANIAQSMANTALGVTQALASGPVPWNIVMAGIVGSMGAVQTALMVKQLAKMADGGLIEGPSHAMGGARIHGTNIEVEGGEFVINKASTAANSNLVNFINDARGPVTLSDLVGVVPTDAAPAVTVDARGVTTDQLLDAINEINFRPVVAVKDIIDRTDEITDVRDLAGF